MTTSEIRDYIEDHLKTAFSVEDLDGQGCTFGRLSEMEKRGEIVCVGRQAGSFNRPVKLFRKASK